MYSFELNPCPECQGPLRIAYTSGTKTVQTMAGVWTIAHQPRYCPDLDCSRRDVLCTSALRQICASGSIPCLQGKNHATQALT